MVTAELLQLVELFLKYPNKWEQIQWQSLYMIGEIPYTKQASVVF